MKARSAKSAKTTKPRASNAIDPSDEAAALWELCEEHAGRPEDLEQAIRAAMGSDGHATTDARAPSLAPLEANAGMYALFLKPRSPFATAP